VWEALQLAAEASKHKVPTQMGSHGWRLAYDHVKAGAIGEVREVHTWTGVHAGWFTDGIRTPEGEDPVPEDYNPNRPYPLVFYLHGGGKGRNHPDQGKRNMVSARLTDNKRSTDAGYSRHAPDSIGYILVSPVKPIARWDAAVFGRLYSHVRSKVTIDDNRVYVTGFSMGGQGTSRVACGSDGTYNIAAMMPLGAWGCNEVKRGTTPETCKTTKTAVWVLHCPLDPVSKIREQLTLFQSHLDCGGYGRLMITSSSICEWGGCSRRPTAPSLIDALHPPRVE
jgi:hypothetical protein